MKPGFALSLSHDGIALLHRVADAWQSLGEADPGAEGLEDALSRLRDQAADLAPDGYCCKIILPNDQIRYQTADFDENSSLSMHIQAAASLDGATPYQVQDLAFDVVREGSRLQIAAVATETLREAETFAHQHGFNPVCFVGCPTDDEFSNEPFFGETRYAAELIPTNDTLKRDTLPVRIVEAEPPQAVSQDEIEVPETEDAIDPEPAPDTSPAEPEPLLLNEAAETEQPSFVSRRRVPTFRTTAPAEIASADVNDGSVPGFAEPEMPFTSRRRKPPPPPEAPPAPQVAPVAKPLPAPAPVVTSALDEAERLTVFGAREDGGFANKLGAASVAVGVGVLLIGGLVAFASGPIGASVQNFVIRLATPEPPAPQFTAPPAPIEQAPALEQNNGPEQISLAALDTDLTAEDAAVLDALRETPEADVLLDPEPEPEPEFTEDDMRANYAVTGIWPVAPEVPSPTALVELNDLYVPGIDPVNPNFDAVALPVPKVEEQDQAFVALLSPAPVGTVFDLDDRGMVIPTPEGSLTPDGITVTTGPPPARQPLNLVKLEDPGEDIATRIRLSGFRPQARPGDLIERTERATLSGLTRSELSELRPRLRPQSAQEDALAAASLVRLDTETGNVVVPQTGEDGFENATERAIAVSLRPDTRPKDFKKIVARAKPAKPAATQTAASTTRVTPRSVAPRIPSSASASREATVKNAINLRKVNLIGVYGKPSSRRALVRLENGRYRKVQVGDRIDGGRVSAIGDSELRYQKSGRAIVLKMPRG